MTKVNDLYVTVGLNFETKTLVFAGMSESLIEGDRAGESRKNMEHPYDVYRTFQFDGRLGPKLDQWLRTNGLPEADAAMTIRGLGEALRQIMDDPE